MAYTDVQAVKELLGKFTIDNTTKPTDVQANAIVDEVAAEIDSVVASAGYTVPVTTPAYFVTALKLLNSAGAAAAVLRSMFPDATGAAETPAYAFWAQWYRDGLARLADGSGIPPEAVASGSDVEPSSYFTNNPDTEVDLGGIAEPFFKRGTTF